MVCKESDITYEELIRSSSSNKLLWLKRFRRTLPMRNWYTHPQVFYILVASKLLIRRTLPMRNWYIFEKRFQIIQRIIIGKKSDITYEELIREKVVLMMVSSSLEASDITYEELILFQILNLLLEMVFFRRTLPMRNWYESKIISFWMNWISRTLPMRNWYSLCLPARIRTEIPQSSDITYEELTRVRY